MYKLYLHYLMIYYNKFSDTNYNYITFFIIRKKWFQADRKTRHNTKLTRSH